MNKPTLPLQSEAATSSVTRGPSREAVTLPCDFMAEAVDTVRRLDRRRVLATKANDVSALSGLLDDDLVYISGLGVIYDKAQYLKAIETRALIYAEDFEVTEEGHRAYAGTVMLIGMMLGHARLDGEQQVFHLRCMSQWRRRDAGWGMMAWQSSVFQPRPL